MAWLSIFRRKVASEGAAAAGSRAGTRRRDAAEADASDIGQARARARRRLIGATVLLGVGIIAFPLLFETEPRPIPVDLPIEIPRRDALPPLAATPSAERDAASGAVADAPPVLPAAQPAAPEAAPAAPASAPTPQPSSAPLSAPASAPASAPVSTSAPPAATSGPAAAEAPRPPPAVDDGARAKALLEGRAAPAGSSQPTPAKPAVAAASPAAPAAPDPGPATAARYVVQVGAYADPDAVRAVRTRVEQLGLRSYTQVVKVEASERTRVRVGPFDDRAEADKVAERLKAAGLPSAVLRL